MIFFWKWSLLDGMWSNQFSDDILCKDLFSVGLVVTMCVWMSVCLFVCLMSPFHLFFKLMYSKVFTCYLWLVIIIIHTVQPVKPLDIIINHFSELLFKFNLKTKLIFLMYYCCDLLLPWSALTKFHCTEIVVDFKKSTSLQCPALYGTDCTALLEFKAIVILPIKVQCSIELFIIM